MNLISWDHGTNRNPQRWRQAVREVGDLGLTRVVVVGYRAVDGSTGAISNAGHELTPGPSPRAMLAAVTAARALGMDVSLKPMLEIDNQAGEGAVWRGSLNFSGPQLGAFFGEYRRYILELAQMAADSGVTRFYIGSELSALTGNGHARPYWDELISDCRRIYGKSNGLLTYAANFDEYARVTFWQALDEIGIDAYFPLSAEAHDGATPDVPHLLAAWQRILGSLKHFAAAHNRRILLSEWGVVPFHGTAQAPFEWEPSHTADLPAALDAYRATLLALDAPVGGFLEGVDFWHWSMSPNDDSNYRIAPNSEIAQLLRLHNRR